MNDLGARSHDGMFVLMKLFARFALLGLTLLALTPLVPGSQHASPGTATVTLAMEPASWLLVAFGLLGGGFLHKRRLPGLNLVSTAEASKAPEPKAPTTSLARPYRLRIAALTAAARIQARRLHAPPSQAVRPGMAWASAAAALMLLLITNTASADTVSFNSQLVSSIPLSPSSDAFSLNNDSGTIDTTQGAFTFQTGDFSIGDSQIPDQVITFSIQDTLTFNGITQTLTFNGQDAVTTAADTLTIFGGSPVAFGDDLFTLQTFTLSSANMGDFPVELQGTITPTPEPGSLLLLGTGIVCGALGMARRKSTPKIEAPHS